MVEQQNRSPRDVKPEKRTVPFVRTETKNISGDDVLRRRSKCHVECLPHVLRMILQKGGYKRQPRTIRIQLGENPSYSVLYDLHSHNHHRSHNDIDQRHGHSEDGSNVKPQLWRTESKRSYRHGLDEIDCTDLICERYIAKMQKKPGSPIKPWLQRNRKRMIIVVFENCVEIDWIRTDTLLHDILTRLAILRGRPQKREYLWIQFPYFMVSTKCKGDQDSLHIRNDNHCIHDSSDRKRRKGIPPPLGEPMLENQHFCTVSGRGSEVNTEFGTTSTTST